MSDGIAASALSAAGGVPRIAIRVKEAAATLGCSTDHIWDLIEAGELRTSKSGHMRLIEYASLVEHFERNRVA